MKLATFRAAGCTSWGVIEDNAVIDVGSAMRDRFPDLRALIAANAFGLVAGAMAGAPRHALTAIEWLPVITEPGKILCVGLN
ncbi:MAG: hypothetical protein QOF70_6906 [Acetobacteraceae bacterium]|jgi:hypothetical protein|nr:hypothetical protein [Acetobacteraceae bacterium]